MSEITAHDLLQAGAHFGHQTKRWNPKMRRYIFGKRNGIHIIDLRKTQVRLRHACDFVREHVREGGKVLFVGTKRQAQETVVAEAERCGMFFVADRWLGGFLTNYATIKVSVDKMKRLEQLDEDRSFQSLTKKERLMLEREREKLSKVLRGVKAMSELPSAVFVVDTRKEAIAVKESRKLGIPVIAIVDTNSDPTEVDYPIPANDDAVRSIGLVTKAISDAAIAGRHDAGDFDFATKESDVGAEMLAEGETQEVAVEETEVAVEETEVAVEETGVAVEETGVTPEMQPVAEEAAVETAPADAEPNQPAAAAEQAPSEAARADAAAQEPADEATADESAPENDKAPTADSEEAQEAASATEAQG